MTLLGVSHPDSHSSSPHKFLIYLVVYFLLLSFDHGCDLIFYSWSSSLLFAHYPLVNSPTTALKLISMSMTLESVYQSLLINIQVHSVEFENAELEKTWGRFLTYSFTDGLAKTYRHAWSMYHLIVVEMSPVCPNLPSFSFLHCFMSLHQPDWATVSCSVLLTSCPQLFTLFPSWNSFSSSPHLHLSQPYL